MKLKLLHKFIIVMALISLLPLTFLGIRLIKMGEMGVKTALLELHMKTAQRLSDELENAISSLDKSAAFLLEAISKMDWENKQILLRSFVNSDPDMLEISAISSRGSEIIKVFGSGAKEGLKNYEGNVLFREALSSGGRTLRIFKDARGNVLAESFYPFGGRFVLRMEKFFPKLSEAIESSRMGKTGFAVLISSGGKPLLWPSGGGFREKAAEIAANPLLAERALKSLSAGSMEYREKKGSYYVGAYSPVPSLKAAVIVRQSRKEAYKYALFMRRDAVILLLVFLFVALGAAYLMARQMARPLMKLTRTAEHVAKGDFTEKVEIDTGDELNVLADTFNRMVDQLKRYSDMQVEKIIQQRQKIDAIMFSIDDGLLMTDYGGNIELINRKARFILGIGENEQTEERNISDAVKNEDIGSVLRELVNNPSIENKKEIEFSSGNITRYFRCFSMEVKKPGVDSGIGVITVFHDITLDKQLEKMKDEFFHSITHDLRNPMGAIKGFIEFLLKEIPGPITEGQRKMLISMDRASFRLLGMINNILDIAKMEAGKMEIKVEEFSVSEMVVKVIDLMESLGSRKNIKFVADVDENLKMKGDAGLIERVFVNLIGNAVKFTPENGSITVSAKDAGEKIRCYVKDTGDGIPPDYLDKVFGKFEQVKGQKAGGTGLGLTISKYVVDAHLGKIWVESELGEGAKFIFEIPKNLAKNENGNVYVEKNENKD